MATLVTVGAKASAAVEVAVRTTLAALEEPATAATLLAVLC